TTQTSATYTGVSGDTYSFYSIATNNLGNQQLTPSSAQATTTVDTVPPASTVTALPAATNTPTFTLSWSGGDNSGGSGIAFYSVYGSDNGGAYTPLLTNTTGTSTTFTGLDGHTYSFYSVATDNVGFQQVTPTIAQATTRVVINTAPVLSPIGNRTIGEGA